MKYVFDIDGTLTLPDSQKDYTNAVPDKEAIAEVNHLFEAGHDITLFTARGASSGKQWHDLTVKQLKEWGIKYDRLIDEGKPSWDVFVDDKAISAYQWKKSFKKPKIGFVASTFDLLHPGHCLMLQDAKHQCDHLIAAVQSDPTIDRPEKNKPVMTLHERLILLNANKYVDEILLYRTEEDLERILSILKPDVRILGSDYKGREDQIVGKQYCKEIYFHDRSGHGWSTTHFRDRIKKS
jgi:glycerol-3-phosphate cytidylyltransferase